MLGDVGQCWAMLGDVGRCLGDVWAMFGRCWAMLGGVGRCWAMLGEVGGIRGTVESVLPLGAATLLCLGGRKDAVGETDVAESCPMLWVDELAEGRGARSVGGFVGVEEVKGTKKSVGWVVEGYGVGPGDVFAGVGDGGGLELYALQ
eukprot:scaffold17224_cov122-Amphora_coffeaeformis.AAC.1